MDGYSDIGAINGVAIGIVKENQDPDNMGRIQVELPHWESVGVTHWARVAAPMAGAGMGMYFLPEIGDEVLVAFENGMLDNPYVIGSLWNGVDKPPENNDGKNNIRVIKSRSGHSVIFDDNAEGSSEKLIISSAAGHCITLDDSSGGERISVVDKSGNKITLDAAQNAIALECAGQFTVKANSVTMEAQTTIDIKANATLTLKGAMTQIN